MKKHGEGSVYRRKDGRYEALMRYVDDKGRRRRMSAYGRTAKEARQKLRDMQRRVEDGHAPRDSSVTVREWTCRWLEVTSASRRATTQATYESLLRTHVLPVLGAVRLCDLSPGHVEDWCMNLSASRSASTTRQALTVLAMTLDAAMRQELVRRNVARLVDRPRVERREAASYSSDQVALLLDRARGERLEPLLSLLAYTGMRKGEALGLCWTDVVLDGDRPHLRVTGTLSRQGGALRKSEPKTDAGRRAVPLVPAAVDALRRQRSRQVVERMAAGTAWAESDYVFTTETGTPIDPRNALRWFYSVRDRAAVARMLSDQRCRHHASEVRPASTCPRCNRSPADYLGGSLHTLRHSAASVLLGSGVPMPVVKDILGHSSIAVTVDMYGHMSPAVIAEEMERGMRGYGAGSACGT
jgi:integrase